MKISSSVLARRLTAATACALLSLTVAHGALADCGKRHGSEHRLDYIFNQLSLTEEQREEVQGIMRNASQERRAAMRERRESGAERPSREEMQAARAEHRLVLSNQLGTVLTTEQVEELVTYLDAHRPHKRGGHSHKGRGYSK